MTIFFGLLIVVAIVYVLFLISQIAAYIGIGEFIGETIAFFLSASLAFFIIYGVIGIAVIEGYNKTDEEDAGWTNIYSMRSSQSISGSFFLGCGQFGEKENYVYFSKDQNGGMRRSSVPVNSSSIYQQDKSKTPCVHIIKIRKKAPDWLGYGFRRHNMPHSERYEFFVPEGTVVETFKVE